MLVIQIREKSLEHADILTSGIEESHSIVTKYDMNTSAIMVKKMV